MSVLLLTTDLACSSQVSAAAMRAPLTGGGLIDVETCMSTARLLERAADTSPWLVILDLNAQPLNCGELVPRLKRLADPVEIIAFGPHVHEARLQAAEDAGCDLVLPRGQFYAQLDKILANQSR
jgi:CheY-like chemotaxis protein